jgi:TPR repeat protein
MADNLEKQYQLAWLYDWGLGVKQDMIEAIKWFVKSAYSQYASAQTELGILYHYGIMATSYRLETHDGMKK